MLFLLFPCVCVCVCVCFTMWLTLVAQIIFVLPKHYSEGPGMTIHQFVFSTSFLPPKRVSNPFGGLLLWLVQQNSLFIRRMFRRLLEGVTSPPPHSLSCRQVAQAWLATTVHAPVPLPFTPQQLVRVAHNPSWVNKG